MTTGGAGAHSAAGPGPHDGRDNTPLEFDPDGTARLSRFRCPFMSMTRRQNVTTLLYGEV